MHLRCDACCALLMLAGLGRAGSLEAATPCERLASLELPHTAITAARTVAAGELPAHCRVAATLTPSADSDIKVEVWLPAAGWNGKYQAVGNGGFAGAISYDAMEEALRRGYATSSTDTGHAGPGGAFALGHPEKVIDYAYRSEHEMAVLAKALIAAHYGAPPRLSYWNGCSAGGKQGLTEAQRYPDDFDGIIAGAPASNWTGRAVQSLWINRAVHKSQASVVPPAAFALIHDAVLAACDARDGVKDGVLEDPARCDFDPGVLACRGAETSACLTAPQLDAVRTIYAPVTHPRTGQVIFQRHEPGSELGWTTMAGAQAFGTGVDHFRYVVMQDPTWNPGDFDLARDADRAAQVDRGTINALDPNLKPFFRRGGKLIQYHGWSDPQISPGSSVAYYKSVVEAVGDAASVGNSYRLFMVPGMAHCRGGDGTSQFDMLSALEQWVETGKAPESIPASRVRAGTVDRTRPLCPYPQVAVYRGSGSTDEAASFVCKVN